MVFTEGVLNISLQKHFQEKTFVFYKYKKICILKKTSSKGASK